MAVTDGISAIVAGVKKVSEVAQRIHDADLQNVIADLLVKAATLKIDMASLREENAILRSRVEAMQKKADIRSMIVYRDDLPYLKEAIAGYRKGPFCPRCLDCGGDLVALTGPVRLASLKVKSIKGLYPESIGSAYVCPHCVE